MNVVRLGDHVTSLQDPRIPETYPTKEGGTHYLHERGPPAWSSRRHYSLTKVALTHTIAEWGSQYLLVTEDPYQLEIFCIAIVGPHQNVYK